MALLKIPQRNGKEQDMQLIQKAKAKKNKTVASVKTGNGLIDKIKAIVTMVDRELGQYAGESLLIQTQEELHEYVTTCIDKGSVALDTETTGLDPLQDDIVGFSIYTDGEPTAYIPINHISYITMTKVADQLSVDVCRQELQRIADAGIDLIMFNAEFDTRVIRHHIGVDLKCTWECYIAARCMNENEPTNALKPLHNKYCQQGQGRAFKFDDLFNGINFNLIPITTAYLYAARDAKITYELWQYQKPFLEYDPAQTPDARNGMNGVAWVFQNIEMKCLHAVIDMEDAGVEFDMAYNAVLKEKYRGLLQEKTQQFYDECAEFTDKIEAYKALHSDVKLDDPINISSPKQLGILLYEILNLPKPINKQTKRETMSTGEEVLQELGHPICKAILEYRTMEKLVSTYIDKLPECVNPNDGRIHCIFNQYGADTGRFSSKDPNLQNIPSHNKDIRKMFKATDGYVLMSSDYSQQEPKCLAALCRKQGDPQMYDTFMQGKDLYSEIASKAFNLPYEECREFREDGTINKAGKERRGQAKSILLGALYGRGVPSIAEQLGCSIDKAQQIKESVFRGFPAIKQFEESSLEMAHDLGYVTTVCGRKRRLPALQLDEFEFKWADGMSPDDDPLDFDGTGEDVPVPYDRQAYYLNKLKRCKFDKKRFVFEEANKEGIWIVDNGKKIADAQRQCVNARIQGSAADLTKLAMIKLSQNDRLKELGFRMLIPVHDEIIAECPQENAKECSKLMAEVMSQAAEDILEMPIKCDVEITKAWYGDTVAV